MAHDAPHRDAPRPLAAASRRPPERDPAPPTPEFAAIARWLADAPTTGPSVLQGPGDDVAWVEHGGPLALSVDTLVEGVHFRPGWLSDEQVGSKALAAALSDLAAARAQPLGCLVALSLRKDQLQLRGDRVMAGLVGAAARWGCPVLGGDTTGADRLCVSVTVLGSGSVFGRSGAQPGDLVQLSGDLGHAAAAVAAWERGQPPSPAALRAFQDPTPRLDLREALSSATAAVDVSDGLLADLGHLAARSGVALSLDRGACLTAGLPPALALSGGEDYELVATAPSPLPGFRVIGRVLPGAGLSFDDGSPLPRRRGWDHGGQP